MYTAPKTRFAAGFIGQYNILTPEQFSILSGESEIAPCDVAFRPEAVEISSAAQATEPDTYEFAATVEGYIPHGNVLRYTVHASGVALHVDVLFRSFKLFEAGQNVYLSIEKRNCLSVR